MYLRRISRIGIACIGAAALVWLARGVISPRYSAASLEARDAGRPETGEPRGGVALACQGRIEGLTETVAVGAGVSGVLESVSVREGQRIAAGQVIASLACSEIEAEVHVGEATLAAAQQARVRLLRGSRDEERGAAGAAVAEAEAIASEALHAYERTRVLYERKVESADALWRFRRDYEVARAALFRAREQEKLVNAPPLPEDVAKLDAEVRLAEARIEHTRRRLEKCVIRAPLESTVLKLHARAGESVSVNLPHVIASLADTTRFRVRAEVDERDIGRVTLGQVVTVSGDALASEIRGRVISIGRMMGRKSVRSGDPAEKSDRDVLDVLAELDAASQDLVVGLRVTVQFLERSDDLP